MTFAEKIKTLRKERGLTQMQLAAETHVSLGVIADIESNRRTWVEDRLTLPCKNVRWRPDTTRPGDYKNQYAKACRTQGCDCCPFFNINRFRQYVINTNPSQQIESKDK